MSGLQVGVEVVPSRREWVRAAALFCNACTTGLAMGDLRRRHCADHDLGRLHWQPRGGHRLGRKVLAEVANVFFIHLESRRVDIAGITVHPDERWMQQMARNVTMEGCGALRECRYLLHDRDTKFTQSFRAIIASGQVEPLVLPARSPNLNAYAERWVRSVKEECLSKVVLFGERSLRRAMREYVDHYHAERNHQGKGNVLLFPRSANTRRDGPVQCRERLGGLLRYYHQDAA
jgi:Integrase core domain